MTRRSVENDGVARTGANRREVLLGASGLAAATAAVGAFGGGAVRAGNGVGEGASGSIAGEVDGIGSFEVLAWSWGVSNSGTTHAGGGAGSGKANVQDLSFTKYVDATSPGLLGAALTGEHFPSGSITWTAKTGSPVITIAVEDLIVTSVSTGGSGGEALLTENVTVNFAHVTFSVDGENATWDAEA
jgi:type VI secretion system secreted protein Hcp